MIYFITDGQYVKIGFTDSSDVEERLNSLQIGNARKLVLLGVIEGDRSTEALLHRIFGDLRVRGEWFRLSLQEQNEQETTAEDFLCQECERAFGSTQALNAHVRWCNGNGQHKANGEGEHIKRLLALPLSQKQ